MEFTKLSEVEVVETATDNDKVLIEQNGEIKRVPKTEVGGGAGGNMLVIRGDESTGGFTANMALSDALAGVRSCTLPATFCMSSAEYTMATSMVMIGDYSTMLGADCMIIMIMAPEEMQLFWTADGISANPPA